MAAEINSNLFLINAPAGSGKTTTIEKNVIKILSNSPNSRILCITFTNRAADELLSRINNSNVRIQTIHSFINDYIKNYYSHQNVINLYFDIYSEKIKKDIENLEQDPVIQTRNEKYKERFSLVDNDFCFETIKNNIKKLSYNELAFNSLYYGGIGHDDLLSFARALIIKYPILRKRLVDKYDSIYIDEYQDTSANVLDFFYIAVKESNTKLYLLGDKMQQIYKNYDGSFEERLEEFDISQKLNTNFRSSKEIVYVLNQLYNDDNFVQLPCEEATNNTRTCKPVLIMTENIEKTLNDEKIISNDTLKLFVFNSDRFKSVNAENLYNSISHMERYSAISKYNAVDVLTNAPSDNPDELMRYLKIISNVIDMFDEKKYGAVIQVIKGNKIFNYSKLKIDTHNDKIVFGRQIEEISCEYNEKQHSIKSFLDFMINKDILDKDRFTGIFENIEYEDFLNVNLKEVKNLNVYLKQPYVSTQHGVKGEGYDSVCFIAENSSNPSVKMYDFFELFSKHKINLTEFQSFYYEYLSKLIDLERTVKIKLSKLKSSDYEKNNTEFNEFLTSITKKMDDNIYFDFIYKKHYQKYLARQNKSNLDPLLKINSIYGILTAYRLFYVGCSRARKELKVLVDANSVKDYQEEFIKRMEEIGFQIF